MAKQQKAQADARRYQRVFDQHKRPWDTIIEIATGEWCSNPIPQFSAPLVPPLKFLQTVPGRPWRLHIDYPAWLNEESAEHQVRAKRVRDLCLLKYGDISQKPGFQVPLEVSEYIGPAPLPLERIRAAMAGHPWVLGTDGRRNGWWQTFPDGTGKWHDYTGKKPAWAEAYFPEPVQARDPLDFMAGDDWQATDTPSAATLEDQRAAEDRELEVFLTSDPTPPSAVAQAMDAGTDLVSDEDDVPELDPTGHPAPTLSGRRAPVPR